MENTKFSSIIELTSLIMAVVVGAAIGVITGHLSFGLIAAFAIFLLRNIFSFFNTGFSYKLPVLEGITDGISFAMLFNLVLIFMLVN